MRISWLEMSYNNPFTRILSYSIVSSSLYQLTAGSSTGNLVSSLSKISIHSLFCLQKFLSRLSPPFLCYYYFSKYTLQRRRVMNRGFKTLWLGYRSVLVVHSSISKPPTYNHSTMTVHIPITYLITAIY